MARPPKDRKAFDTANVPLSPTEEASLEQLRPGGKPVAVVTKRGGRQLDRKVDAEVFKGGKLTRGAATDKVFREAVALRLADWSIPDIAEELGVPAGLIVRLFTEYQQHVTTEQIAARLDQTAVPLAVDNLVHGLLAGDKEYTIETLKGRGFFKRHSDGGDGGPRPAELPALRIEFISPAGAAKVEIGGATEPNPLLGKVVGAMSIPAEIAEVPGTRSPLPPAQSAALDPVASGGVPLAPTDADPPQAQPRLDA